MNEPNQDVTQLAEAPAGKLRTFSAAQKAEWVERYQQSGLGLREFSSQHGLGYMSLHRWVKKQGGAGEPGQRRSPVALDFSELKLPSSNRPPDWAVELTLPNGTVLRLTKDTPPALVEQLLRVC